MDEVGRLLVEAGRRRGVSRPADRGDAFRGVRGEVAGQARQRGPRLVLFHRAEGGHGLHPFPPLLESGSPRSAAWRRISGGTRSAMPRPGRRLTDERGLHCDDVVTLVPPRDVHNHGHVAGTGPSPYSLILLGDDMLLFEREEYDPEQGTWRQLAPRVIRPAAPLMSPGPCLTTGIIWGARDHAGLGGRGCRRAGGSGGERLLPGAGRRRG